jgi:hypothetical protein
MKTTWMKRLIARIQGRDLEAEYWESVRQFGRITEGHILEINHDAEVGTSVYYSYTLANVAYETSHVLTPEQLAKANKYVPGARVTVRFDPKSPGSAMVE